MSFGDYVARLMTRMDGWMDVLTIGSVVFALIALILLLFSVLVCRASSVGEYNTP